MVFLHNMLLPSCIPGSLSPRDQLTSSMFILHAPCFFAYLPIIVDRQKLNKTILLRIEKIGRVGPDL